MTDVRQLAGTLVLGENLEGRFFVRSASQELIVEVYKPFGRSVSLGVEPGTYEIRVEQEKRALLEMLDEIRAIWEEVGGPPEPGRREPIEFPDRPGLY